MSNEYKEWFEDCKEQAWEDIGKIADIVEEWEQFKDGGQAYEYFSKIRDILKESRWL